ncbi:hypothetical protein L1987_88200 [Smallanthus sonchifolius]|nr:hypothetical protein L1987_88200 [Smallanthus sonchifolius]
MFQFAKFEKSKERRLATELGYGFPIGDPWITDGISPWPFASESVLPSQCPGIHPMHSFRSCTHGANVDLNTPFREVIQSADFSTLVLPSLSTEAQSILNALPMDDRLRYIGLSNALSISFLH